MHFLALNSEPSTSEATLHKHIITPVHYNLRSFRAKSVVITGLECRDFYFTWKSEVFTCDSSCSVYFQAGMSPLRIFDIFQTYFISILLLITIFFACLVYTKLLFYLPHSRNYTFKLIVFNGIVVSSHLNNITRYTDASQNLLSCSMYLLVYQLTSYNFMYRFYLYLKDRGFYIIAGEYMLKKI